MTNSDDAPTPSSSKDPIFGSQDEALAEATRAYKSYFEVSDEIASRGGLNPSGISDLVTPEFLSTTESGFDDLEAQSLHTNGRTQVRNVSLQSYRELNEIAEVTIYVCVDISAVSVLNSAGENVTPPDRANTLSLVAELVSPASTSSNLVLSNNEPWSGDSFC
nr:hypothetical protein [Clavibacter michiganensis]